MEGAQKTSHKKRGIVFHESEKHPENARGSKDLQRRGTAFHESEMHPENARGSKDLRRRGTMFHKSDTP
jgi:hypothetical protein